MQNRLEAKFHPVKKKKSTKYYKRTITLLIIAVLILLLLFTLKIFELIGYSPIPILESKQNKISELRQDISKVHQKIDSILHVEKLALAGSLAFDSLHVPYMYTGHSHPMDSNTTRMTRKQHHDLFESEKTVDGIKVGGHYGIDISQWQNKIDWEQVHNDTIPERMKFFIIKATQGKSHIDKYFKYNWKKAHSKHTLVGAYHYYDYNHNPLEQAENYIKTVTLNDKNLAPIIDIELSCSGCSELDIDQEKFVRNLKIFLEKIESYYGVQPILYTYSNFYKLYLNKHFNNYPFWMARYSSNPPVGLFPSEEDAGNTPSVLMWQFSNSEKIKGIIGPVDISFMPEANLDSLRFTTGKSKMDTIGIVAASIN